MKALVLVALAACSDHAAVTATEPTPKTVEAPKPPPEVAFVHPDSGLEHDQQEYVDDVVAFTKTTKDAVRERMKRGSAGLQEEWVSWEKQGAMTDDRVKAFYKQTTNYIFELAEWHLWVEGKRESDLALVEDMRKKHPKNILDFGGGTGLMAIPLARAGLDVTLADLDSTTLKFAAFRAERHGDKVKLWKSDVEAMPPDKKYDVIMALDVLEHLPKAELHAVVDKLIKLKHAGTEIVLSAPFGRTAVHPMHMDADDDTHKQVERLKTEQPKE